MCKVLFCSLVISLLLSEFQDWQLAITLAAVQRWVQMMEEASYSGLLSQDKTFLGLYICRWEEVRYFRLPWQDMMRLGLYVLGWGRWTILGYHSKVLSSPTPCLSLALFFLQKPINCVLSKGGQHCSIQVAQPEWEDTVMSSQHRRQALWHTVKYLA